MAEGQSLPYLWTSLSTNSYVFSGLCEAKSCNSYPPLSSWKTGSWTDKNLLLFSLEWLGGGWWPLQRKAEVWHLAEFTGRPWFSKTAGDQEEREAKMLQISAVLEEQVETAYVCNLSIPSYWYTVMANSLGSFSVCSLVLTLSWRYTLHFVFFAFLFNCPKLWSGSLYISVVLWIQSLESFCCGTYWFRCWSDRLIPVCLATKVVRMSSACRVSLEAVLQRENKSATVDAGQEMTDLLTKALFMLQSGGTRAWPSHLHTCFFSNSVVCLLAGYTSVVVERVHNASVVLKGSLAPCFSGVEGHY